MPSPPPPADSTISSANERGILIIDDDETQRDWLSSILRRAHETVVFTANDGVAALECLRLNDAHIGLLICDLQMPGMDGMALLRRIGEAGHQQTIIISSGSDSSITRSVELMVAAFGLKVLGSLPKPVTSKALESLLQLYRQGPVMKSGGSAIRLVPADITRAVENAEFVPFYQPKVNFATGALAGVEALVRWIHPSHGILRPDEFLPFVAEQNKLVELTQAVIATAIERAGSWRKEGIQLTVNVNLSLSALDNPFFCEEVQAQLSAHGLAARDMTFEILETAAMKDVGRTLETMTRLRLNGFGLAIDDFGTGFSSFEQLSSIPFTELKIDRSFVSGVGDSPRMAAVVRSCIDLAHRLNLKVVAEGVESQADWDFLLAAGATEAQGYLIARPLPEDQFLMWAHHWRSRAPQPK